MTQLPEEEWLQIFVSISPYGRDNADLSNPDDHGEIKHRLSYFRCLAASGTSLNMSSTRTAKFKHFATNERSPIGLSEDQVVEAYKNMPLNGLEALCHQIGLGQHVRGLGGQIGFNRVETEKVEYSERAQTFVRLDDPPNVSDSLEALCVRAGQDPQ